MRLASVLPEPLRTGLRRLRQHLLAPVRGGMRNARTDFALGVPFGFAMQPATRRIAVICHMFHEDLAPEFCLALSNLPQPADLFISTDSEHKIPAIRQTFAHWGPGHVEVDAFPNRGRDIAPKLAAFRNVYDGYDLILFVHSKKSLTSDLGDHWRRVLLDSLAGSREVVASILTLFDLTPDLGFVVPQHFAPVRGLLHWDGNYSEAQRLARRMQMPLARHRVVDFPSGSMFWARPLAMRPLTALNLDFADFPPETNQLRGTLQHAIERMFLLVCEQAGYRWAKVAGPLAGDPFATRMPIKVPGDIAGFLARHRFDLLPGRGTSG